MSPRGYPNGSPLRKLRNFREKTTKNISWIFMFVNCDPFKNPNGSWWLCYILLNLRLKHHVIFRDLSLILQFSTPFAQFSWGISNVELWSQRLVHLCLSFTCVKLLLSKREFYWWVVFNWEDTIGSLLRLHVIINH